MRSKQPDVPAAMPSPCISICQMDPQADICVGCYRTRQEIASWSSLNIDEQRALLAILNERRAAKTGVRRRPTRRQKTNSKG